MGFDVLLCGTHLSVLKSKWVRSSEPSVNSMLLAILLWHHISKHTIFHSHSRKNLTVLSHKIRILKNILALITSSDDTKLSYRKSAL